MHLRVTLRLTVSKSTLKFGCCSFCLPSVGLHYCSRIKTEQLLDRCACGCTPTGGACVGIGFAAVLELGSHLKNILCELPL